MSIDSTPEPSVIECAGQCDRGKLRAENQDAILHSSIALGELLIVADGIGGYTGGAIASRMTIDGFQKSLEAVPPDASAELAIRIAATETNTRIVAKATVPGSEQPRMGSTVVLALIQQIANETAAWIGHIGDSRAYLVREGRLALITHDHSAVQVLLDEKLITVDEASHHPQASMLTRSLGHRAEVEIDIQRLPLLAGDSLLLCSDGLWGYVPGLEIQSVLANQQLSAEAAAKALLELALTAGGHDNIGIELARLKLPVHATKLNPS